MQLTVEVKNTRVNAGDVEEFLSAKIKSNVEAHGSQVRIQDASAKEVKLLLHKFLHQRALDKHRVEVVHPGLVEVYGPEHPKPHFVPEPKGSPPSLGAAMPFLFPSSPALPGSPVKKKKKIRK